MSTFKTYYFWGSLQFQLVAVFILKEADNTTVKQIHGHLRPYFEWIEPLTNLQVVYIIATDKYCSVDIPLKLLDNTFLQHAKILSKNVK